MGLYRRRCDLCCGETWFIGERCVTCDTDRLREAAKNETMSPNADRGQMTEGPMLEMALLTAFGIIVYIGLKMSGLLTAVLTYLPVVLVGVLLLLVLYFLLVDPLNMGPRWLP